MPASRITRMVMIAVSVRRALRTAGSANAGTPLLTASTPVIAVHPLANARNSNHALTPLTADGTAGGATTGIGCPPPIHALTHPMASTIRRHATNRYVGSA